MTYAYIDSDVFISSEIDTEKNHKKSKEFMEFVLKNKSKDIVFTTSVFTFVELASAMIRRTGDDGKAYKLLYKSRNTWKNKIQPISFGRISSENFIEELIDSSLNFLTKGGDTIHAWTIYTRKVNMVVTWNKKDFKKMEDTIEDLVVLNPTEFLRKVKKSRKTNRNPFRVALTKINFEDIKSIIGPGQGSN